MPRGLRYGKMLFYLRTMPDFLRLANDKLDKFCYNKNRGNGGVRASSKYVRIDEIYFKPFCGSFLSECLCKELIRCYGNGMS